MYDQPDAGLWELRGSARVHTFSDRHVLGRVRPARAHRDAARARRTRRGVARECRRGSPRSSTSAAGTRTRNSFVSTADGEALDASLLLLAELGFVHADDPRFAATVDAIERELKRGDFIFRYVERDDFGEPENAFLVCTFWYVNALAAIGRRDEARALFEHLLACRNRHGLLAEHLDLATGELWGNFVQTYSMVGLITSAIRLSTPWDEAF